MSYCIIFKIALTLTELKCFFAKNHSILVRFPKRTTNCAKRTTNCTNILYSSSLINEFIKNCEKRTTNCMKRTTNCTNILYSLDLINKFIKNCFDLTTKLCIDVVRTERIFHILWI